MEEWLKDLIEDDELGLLNVKPKPRPISSDDRLVAGFEEINKFIDNNGREPKISTDILESTLFYRLTAIRENSQKINHLRSFDRNNLLKKTDKTYTPTSISEILDDDDMGLLSSDERDIFNVREELRKDIIPSVRTHDYVGRHKRCSDFDNFEHLFKVCQVDLKNKKRTLKRFTSETSVKEGNFYVLKGILVYVDKVGKEEARNNRKQARLRCIYENGTESDILSRSLAKSLFLDGRIVTENVDEVLAGFSGVDEDDKPSGYVYVLKSLSKDSQIRDIKDLYKIGYSETTVEDRLRNAANEPTYLMAKVKIVATYKMYNINTQKFEDLLHRFFSPARVSIDIIDNNGTRCTPREWFQVPFEIIQQAIILLQSGDIVNYTYSRELRDIVGI